MPKVPVYEPYQVENKPVAIPQQKGLSPEAFGAGVGKALGDVSNDARWVDSSLTRIQEAENTKADAAALDKAKNDLLSSYNRLYVNSHAVTGVAVEPGYNEDGEKQPGAPGLVDQYMGEFADEVQRINKGLLPRQQEKLAPFITDHTAGLERSLLTHEMQEREKYQKSNSEALVKSLVDQMIVAGTPEEFNSGVERLREPLGNLGFSGEALGQKQLEIVNLAQKQRVANAIKRGDVTGAREVFDSIELDPKSTEYAELKHALDGAEATEKGASFVDSIFIQPANNAPVTNSPTMFKQIEDAVKSGKLTPEAGKVAEAELFQRITRSDHAASTAVHAFKADVWQKIDDNKLNLRGALNAVDAAPMPGDERVQLKKAIEHYFKPPADPEAKLIQKMEQDSALAELMLRINNGDVRIKTLKEAQAYSGSIGRANVFRLASYGEKYEKALASPNITGAQFDTVIEELRGAGIKDIPQKKIGTKNNPAYLAMQAEFLDELVNSQVKSGKMLDDDGVKQGLRKLVTSKIPVTTRTSFLGIPSPWTGTTEKAPWEVQNPEAIDVKSLLKQRLGREPSQSQIDAAKEALRRKSQSRRQAKTRVPFGGINGAE